MLRMRQDIPLIGSQLTLALVEAKLTERAGQQYLMTTASGGSFGSQVTVLPCCSRTASAVEHCVPKRAFSAAISAGGTAR